MPISRLSKVPESPQELTLPEGAPLFFVFISSVDPATLLPWCPDVRAALPTLEATFDKPDAPALSIVEVGQKPEWKDLGNMYRTKWNVNCIPALVRYEIRDGAVVEVGRLVEAEILVPEKLAKLLDG